MSYSSRTLLAALVLLLTAYAVPDAHAQASDTTAAPADTSALVAQAETIAENWLALIDAGNYGQSWEKAAEMMKQKVTKKQWKRLIGTVLPQKTGAFQERTLKNAQFRTQLGPLPEGQYVILQYDASYEKGSFREVVVLTKQEEAWKVIGYRVLPA